MSDTPSQPRPFEDALAELERTVRELEEGRLGLDESLARYEQGVGLIKECHARLRSAEQRIQVLTGLAEDGSPVLQPFRHEATASAPPPGTGQSSYSLSRTEATHRRTRLKPEG